MSESRLKILAIIPSGFCFGLQHVTLDLFSKFQENIQSCFLITKWGNGDIVKILTDKGIPFKYSWLGMFSRKMDLKNVKMSFHALLKLPKLYFDFFRIQRTIKPDVLYFANHHELILLFPVLLFNKRKVVCHMHDPAPAIPFQKKTFRLYDKVVDKYVAISENVRQRTINLGCNPDKIVTIHNGIELPKAERHGRMNQFCEAAGWGNDSFLIGITGQMTETKGHLDLLEAFSIVFTENSKARLVIGGRKQEPYYNVLQEKIKSLHLENLVMFPEWQADINTFFQNIDVFVLASRHDEGYGLVVAEAMANELPVVITQSGGAVEIVEDNENGFIIPKSNPVAMAEKLVELSVNREQCALFGKSGKKRISCSFDLNVQAGKLAEFLLGIKR